MIDLQTNSTLRIQTWPDPPHAGPNVDVRSRYADHFWIPGLGPTAMCLLRVLVRQIGHRDHPVTIEVRHLLSELGLDASTGLFEIERALARLLDEGIASVRSDRAVRVRVDLPYLSQIQVERLAPEIAVAHRAALFLRESVVEVEPDKPLPPRLLRLTATVDDLVARDDLDPRQLAYRWQHVMRLAEEGRDEAILDWASPDLEVTLAEGQLKAQGVNEAVWAAQHLVAQEGQLPADVRATLNASAAGLVDWVVSEFPNNTEIWDLGSAPTPEQQGPASFEDLLDLLGLRDVDDDDGG